MTPFQKLKGRTWRIALPSFGEIVDYRRRAKSKLDARWQEGVYLGLRLTSSEKIIGTPSGILVVQSIRRKPADKQFNLEMLKAVKGTPWQPNPEKGVEQPTCDLVDGLAEEILAETFYDDLTGKELPAEGVKAARAEEVSVIKQMGVWEVIPRPANEKVIGTRWIDINKGDGARLKLRSRLEKSLRLNVHGDDFTVEKSLRLNVHGDDFTVVGSYEELKWLEAELGKVWTVETRGILARPGSELPGVIHQISVLNRLVTWTHEGGLEKGVSVTTPLVKVKEEDMDKTPLGTAEAAMYRSIAMRIGYLSMDRPDLLRTVRELAKGLKEPQQHHWGLLKRAARYLRGAPRLVQLIPYQEHFTSINAWSDSDHAGCIKTRKSTTGTVIQLGESTVKTAAKGQAVIALSTGEAEYYGLISTASTALGEQAMMADWGHFDRQLYR
eukprot:s12533_g1.t1